MRFPQRYRSACTLAVGLGLLCAGRVAFSQTPGSDARYRDEVKPLLQKYCYDCHGNGEAQGGKAFDKLEAEGQLLGNTKLWMAALANVRAGVMPPQGHARPSADEVKHFAQWVKADVFQIDPAQPDPGRIVIRRLNRTEYQNTVKDLLGYDFNAKDLFPPDDTGYGFDNIGEVLMISPLLMEKYLQAAEAIVDANVPTVSREVAVTVLTGRDFRVIQLPKPEAPAEAPMAAGANPAPAVEGNNAAASVNNPAAPIEPAAGNSADGIPPAANPAPPVSPPAPENAAPAVNVPPASEPAAPNAPAANPNAPEANPNAPPGEQPMGRGRGRGRGRRGADGNANPNAPPDANAAARRGGRGGMGGGPAQLSFKVPTEPGAMSTVFRAVQPGRYVLNLEVWIRGSFYVDPGQANVKMYLDGQELHSQDYHWEERSSFFFKYEFDWAAGNKEIKFVLTPLEPQVLETASGGATNCSFQVGELKITGPLESDRWVKPKGYERYFTRDLPPLDPVERQAYAREILQPFAAQAFRRPVDNDTLDRLVALAKSVYDQPNKTFEEGVGRAMVGVLSSPRFIYRTETVLDRKPGEKYPLVDEYALASRLSYFLWSTAPDQELLSLAGDGRLRAELDKQIDRMLADPRSGNFLSGFVGQWLRSRELSNVLIDAEAIVEADESPEQKEARVAAQSRGRGRNNVRTNVRAYIFDAPLRDAMRQETEMTFGHILRNNRSLLELLDSNYTFLNQRLAEHYGIPDVQGQNMRMVELPEDSLRGGLLTQGTLLTVTSNPERTSPVKRGLYILENLLGTPPAAPPPNIPELDEAKEQFAGRTPSLREVLEMHRANALCSSCHGRMDPLGLALENFNAMGMFREKDAQQPINPAGQLITGESFQNISELKKILVENRRADFYRCVTEKLLTYAVGRGMEYPDTDIVDTIVEDLEAHQGEVSRLVRGVIHSAPFQRLRERDLATAAK